MSTTIPRSAEACHRMFCAVERTPEWLKILRSAVVTERDDRGRARRVAFLARLRHGTIGYSLHYRYRDLRVSFATPLRSELRVHGYAQFFPLGGDGCLMTYGLEVTKRGLPPFDDSHFEAHAPSAVLADFRDFVLNAVR